MLDGIKNMTLSNLFGSLHQTMLSFIKGLDELIGENKEVTFSDIKEIRGHIKERLDEKEGITDKQKLLKLLDLFSTDKAVIELMKDEAEEWLSLLDAIEANIEDQEREPTDKERYEIDEIRKLTGEIRGLIRK
jgi:hypothetical protein